MKNNAHIGPLIKLLNKEFELLHSEKARSIGLTPAQLFVLHYISSRSGESICHRDIEKQFELSHSTVSGIISRLEAKGFIVCQTDKNDRRFRYISLTRKAGDCEEEMKKHIEMYENQLTQGFSDKEKEMLISFIMRLLENVDVKLGDCRLKEEGKC